MMEHSPLAKEVPVVEIHGVVSQVKINGPTLARVHIYSPLRFDTFSPCAPVGNGASNEFFRTSAFNFAKGELTKL